MTTDTYTVRANATPAKDDKNLTPDNQLAFLQIDRGANCVITSYRAALCTPKNDGTFSIDHEIGVGTVPDLENPDVPPPLFEIGPPASVVGKVIVVIVDAIALPPGEVGKIEVMVAVYQRTVVGPPPKYRRAGFSLDSRDAKSVQGDRFEISFVP